MVKNKNRKFDNSRVSQLMRVSAASLLLLSGFAFLATTSKIARADPPIPNPSGWRLVFNDEFDGSSLNVGKWATCDFPDTDGVGCKGGASGELAWYQPDDVIVNNGILRLRAQQRNITDGFGRQHNYTSGMLSTVNRFQFQYGYTEFRAKMPRGRAMWPAFYTLPVQRRSKPPEIDIVEMLGTDTKTAYLTYHFDGLGPGDPNYFTQGIYFEPADFANDYHTYGVDWQPGLLVWYIDGIERFRTTDRVTAEPHNLLIFLGVGINWNGNNFPDASTVFPNYLDIDYVRVWKRGASQTSYTDNIDDFTTIFASSGAFQRDTSSPSLFGGDTSRLYRYYNDPDWAVWKLDNLGQARVTTYFWPNETVNHYRLFVSSDNANYTQVTPTIIDSGGSWRKIEYVVNAPAGTNYIKVQFPTTSANWTTQIGSVTMTASANPPTPTPIAPTPTPIPPTPTPPPSGGALDDPLNNLSKSFATSGSFLFDSSLPSYFDNDTSRLMRTTTSAQWVTWRLDNMSSFKATAYFWPNESINHFTFATSSDNASYANASPNIVTTLNASGGWTRVEYTLSPPQGTSYMRVTFPTNTRNWTPQLGAINATTGGGGTVVDPIDNLTKVYQYLPNIQLDGNYSQYFDGDISRAMRTTTSNVWMTWKIDGASSFKAVTYFWPNEAISHFSFATSADNVNFTTVSPSINTTTSASGGWTRVEYTLSPSQGTNYVRVTFPTNTRNWTPQISRVEWTANSSGTNITPPDNSGWQLDFNDEFDAATLDTTKWNTVEPYTFADGNGAAGGNGEEQWMQSDETSVQNGYARLRAQRRNFVNQLGKSFQYTSGMIGTWEKYNFRYGYAEARVRVPAGRGYWPAFWLRTIHSGIFPIWPPEIDVMEILGHEPNVAYQTLHFRQNGNPSYIQTVTNNAGNFSQDWHTFAVKWEPGLLVWYIDGVERTRTTQNVPDVPMSMILNLAIGGNWAGSPDATTVFPGYYDIDYVRVWKKTYANEPPVPNLQPATAITDTLSSTNGIFARSSNTIISSVDPTFFDGDTSVIERTNTQTATVTWQRNNISHFFVSAFFPSGTTVEHLKFYTSPDNVVYTPVDFGYYSLPSNWRKVDYRSILPAGTNYLRIEFPAGGSNTVPKIGTVVLGSTP
jgi:beta-glucanase (GH16 family)